MNLVIVESPTKARKLSSYLGDGFTIRASVGHIQDLPKKKLGVDVEHDFEPIYEIDPDKEKVVRELTDLAKKSEKIYLATDPDREGEAIAWHVREILKAKFKSSKSTMTHKFLRATFHEITKTAVMSAIDHPTKLNMQLVDAQQARRVVDRLVGYTLSPVLWKKVRRGLSAGRVQSVALRLIVEREKEIEAFKADEYWEVDVLLNSKSEALNSKEVGKFKTKNSKDTVEFKEFPASMFSARVTEVKKKKYTPTKEGDVLPVVQDLQKAKYQIASVERKERKRVSLPPFTTSTLQQAAANRLGMTSKQTMRTAQQLYEEGLITYHRTDSVSLSQQAVSMAREKIEELFGKTYVPDSPRYFANRSKNAQEAHEAIRVTHINIRDLSEKKKAKFTSGHNKLYDLIWRRFVASQMDMAVYDQTTISVLAKNKQEYGLRSSGSVLKFDGWMKLFPGGEDAILPDVSEGDKVNYVDLNSVQKFTQPPARYNDASLVKELEKRGIGRPSTYASIISVIVDRGYVDRQEKRFFATAVGTTVSDFLLKNFPDIMDYDFTAEMEEDLDRIARGEKEWKKVMKEFYTPFEKKVEMVTDKAKRVQIPVESTGVACPDCGSTEKGEIVIRTGRFGKFKSCSRFPECKFTENIVEKLEGQKCPLCAEGDVIIKNSRWGKSFFGCGRYPECDWASWKKPEPGFKLTAKEWAVMQKERQERIEKRKAGKLGKTVSKKKTTKKKKKVVKKKK